MAEYYIYIPVRIDVKKRLDAVMSKSETYSECIETYIYKVRQRRQKKIKKVINRITAA